MWKRFSRIPVFPLCVAGFFVGIIFTRMTGFSLEFLEEERLTAILGLKVDRAELLYAIGKLRLWTAIVIMIASTTYLAKVVSAMVVLRFGISLGSFLTCALTKYGIKGILLIPAAFLPQYLLYLPGFYLIIRWGEEVYRVIYQQKKLDGRKGILPFLAALLCILLGIVAEAWINPLVLRGILADF